jgi:hypothetical protein
MNRRIFITLTFLFIISSVFAEDKNNIFTDRDLNKYKESSFSNSSEDYGAADNNADSKDNFFNSKSDKQKLKRFAIPYNAYEGTARRIIIPVMFNGRITVPMLLDTGAPGMHISHRLAEKLDILNNDEGKLWVSVGGIGGTIPAIFTIIETIQVGEAENRFIPTTITPSISNHFEGLIGMDFMANYSIHIDTRKHVVVFEELPQRSDMPAGHDEAWWRITFRNFKSMRSQWENFSEILSRESINSSRSRRLKIFTERQYEQADELYNRLSVYASEHSVPLEWR